MHSIIYAQHYIYIAQHICSTRYYTASVQMHDLQVTQRTAIQHNTYAALCIHSTIWYNTDPASHMPLIIQHNTYTVRPAHNIIYYTPIHGTEIHHKYSDTMYNTKYTIYHTAPHAPYTMHNIVPCPKYVIQYHIIYRAHNAQYRIIYEVHNIPHCSICTVHNTQYCTMHEVRNTIPYHIQSTQYTILYNIQAHNIQGIAVWQT